MAAVRLIYEQEAQLNDDPGFNSGLFDKKLLQLAAWVVGMTLRNASEIN